MSKNFHHHGRIVQLVAGSLCAAALAGCSTSIHNPDAGVSLHPEASTTTHTSTNPIPVHERGGTIPATARRQQNRLTSGASRSTPQATLVHYAELWGTWTAKTIPTVQAQVASISLGPARDEAEQAIASYKLDTALHHSTMTSTTRVVGVAQGVGAAAGYWVVTTTEKIAGTGDSTALAPSFHVNYAKLTRVHRGWIVSTWSPRS